MPESERVYMVAGEDEHGDQHLLATDNLARARAALVEMEGRLVNVRGNWAIEEFAREQNADDP